MIARLAPYLALVVAEVVFVAAFILIVDRNAVNRVRASIERQNNASGGLSDRDRSSFIDCLDGGGMWHYGTRKCARPAPSGRH
ncbi:hypothetical protein [Agrobacterium radiobacter]|uniref:hypothetical protein n=1 Tax=Agrobacterium radiobacter TaxID=362 RepID=UPI00036998BE|nr:MULTISPECIES: hypothetical protein [Agrobacterium tumefaciens complex]EPR18582.1 hypothetical protein L902_03405 [Agrobacterium radiobacter DSM 30147]KWT78874.1 hypothetical protein ASH09_23925 [Agrobacterium radiobacter]